MSNRTPDAANPQMLGETIGAIHRPMLPSRASKTDHQMIEPAIQIILQRQIGEGENAVKKILNDRVRIQKPHDIAVSPRHVHEERVPSGIGQAATIEHKPTPVAGHVVGDSASGVSKGKDIDYEFSEVHAGSMQR